MKKNNLKKIIYGLFLITVLLFSYKTEASTSVNFVVTVGSNYLYNSEISVNACDSDNDGSPDGITAYCALMQSGLSVDGSWSSYGYFINGINGVNGYADSLGDWHYWEFYTNTSYASVGIASYVLSPGDTIWLNFLNPSESDMSKSSYHGGGRVVRDEFSLKSASDFIVNKQKEDGSFGLPLYTDWVAIGIAKDENTDIEIKDKLKEFLKNQDFKPYNVTDYERHAMALMSMGIDPYDGTKINYIKKIVDSFDGVQIGDKNLINDDIFGLIVLQNAGYKKDDKIISSVVSNIISKQSENGSWGSVDMTAAGIVSLHDFSSLNNNVQNSIKKAYKFLKKNEVIKKNENFGNVFSSSWAMQAFRLEDYYEDEVERSLKFLTRKQSNIDGYLKEGEGDSLLWATAYSMPAVMGLSWNDILDNFEVKK